MKKQRLYVDQYGGMVLACTLKELQTKVGGGRINKMYYDKAGTTFHIGYVVGKRWFTMYEPIEVPNEN